MKISTTALLASTLIAATSAQAIVQGYWDMDSSTTLGKLPANQGEQAGSVSASFTNITVGFDGGINPDITGTNLNILPPTPVTNRAVGFYRFGVVYADGAFVMNDFDFTDLTDVAVSFAYRSENSFTWDTNLEIDYRIDDGSWIDWAEGETYMPDWAHAVVYFDNELDGESNVDFRIRTSAWASVTGYLDLDNVQVTAVPEPSTYAMLIGAATLGLVAYRRRR